jgi:hypothetical protein
MEKTIIGYRKFLKGEGQLPLSYRNCQRVQRKNRLMR